MEWPRFSGGRAERPPVHGADVPGRVYASPFTAVASEGPEALFGSADVTRIFEAIDDLTKAAA